jgi:hypothetical protein
MTKAETMGFEQPAVRMRNLADLAGQADFPEGDEVRGQRHPRGGRDDGDGHWQIGGGLRHAHSPGNRTEHIGPSETDIADLLEHGQQKADPACVDTTHRTAGTGGRRLGHERL